MIFLAINPEYSTPFAIHLPEDPSPVEVSVSVIFERLSQDSDTFNCEFFLFSDDGSPKYVLLFKSLNLCLFKYDVKGKMIPYSVSVYKRGADDGKIQRI